MEGPGELLSAKAFAVKHIRALLYSGEFDEDGKLSIAALSDQLGVSRTPVRDALWQLAGEGLVTVSPRVGAFIRRLTPDEAKDIYRIKVAIEPLMAGWAAERADAERRAAHREKVQDLVDIAESNDVEKYIACLEERRANLLDMAGSPPLAEILSVIDGRVRLLRFRNLSQPRQLGASATQHVAVADAVAAGDADAATEAMREHMLDAQRRVMRLAERAHGDGEYWLSSGTAGS
jgi:GntR family transcriptional regulator, rspAB operon transcriptional repressor